MAVDAGVLPESGLLAVGPAERSLWADALDELRRLTHYRHLARRLFSTSLRTENVGTVFGYFWWILDPLLTGVTYVILVDVILKSGGDHFPVFVFTSVVVWKSFLGSIRNAMGQTAGKIGLMKQIPFPRSIVPLVAVAAEVARFAFGLLALLVFASAFGLFPGWKLLYLPLVVLVQLPLMLGFAFGLSALGLLFRDVDNLSQFVFRAWFFLSPAIYSISKVPGGTARRLYDLNPFAVLFPAYHAIFMGAGTPDLAGLGWVALGSTVVLVCGYLVFVRLESAFAKVR
jgi:homopolymeric O-antigen transport system permease protein